MTKQAFTPPILPPELDTSSLLKLTVSAREAVARYDEAVKRLPNADLIRRSFATKEAVASSQIEGTQTTFRQALEQDASLKSHPVDKLIRSQIDYEEVSCYRRAIRQGYKLVDKHGLSIELIKQLHITLLDSFMGKDKQPGQFRHKKVYIGSPGATIEEASYIPPDSPAVISKLMDNLIEFVGTDYDQFDELVKAAIAHYQFEAIHPFMDGNGRIGRILISLQLYHQGLTSLPNLYVSEFLERHRRDYYQALRAVSEQADWLGWIQLFLRAVRHQAELSKQRIAEIEQLYAEINQNIHNFNSKYAPAFLTAIFKHPIATSSLIAKEAGISNRQTVGSLINKFQDAGLISTSRFNEKYIQFDGLLAILD